MGAGYESIDRIEHYYGDEPTEGLKHSIRTTGCSCCSTSKPLTAEVLEDAIKQAEKWLEELRSYEQTI
jgi:hypothetical protein